MKTNFKINFLIVLTIPVFLFSCRGEKTEKEAFFRVMSFNIRLDTPADGADAWPYRKEMVASMIRFHQAGFAGLQEALHHQVSQLDSLLPAYSWIGTGRDDGRQAGEYCPVFYLEEKFSLLTHGQFWLSETPEIPGKGWDAACPRIVTWGKFRDTGSGKEIFVFNTHFDHMGDTARLESAKLLKERIASIAGDMPVVVTGDFNALPESAPVTELRGQGSGTGLRDAFRESRQPPHGPDGTWSGFRVAGEPGRRIDYIFIRGNAEVEWFATLSDSWSGRFPSDHLPVLAGIRIP